ncbi:MAG: D-aminoacyl-tRNA deacylase [Candidatus Woesearchaeota archaeon]|jgi:D-aminoacyl-tRNA deacylase|nr:D-aminoacyl-tRNA deacylase [Candidatus Woesearchaeota archaeon]MDP7622539.1 D-aminoacyl-tRNA deacylase [Candidatus Woesearchaeota archaeon]HJN56704.1 D-aminoacyl-tRNA deacylase [Candidatus Woesearchaeota archaeon]|tara:strand:- start:21638 stop:22465 length:828 start_codon:yes stop_codon:yes gene_type:complete
MDIVIISSAKDPASMNIKENLLTNFEFDKSEEKFDNNDIFELKSNSIEIKLYTINSELIYTDNLDTKIHADIFIFISKHQSAGGIATLTIHPIGNFGKAEYGGKENKLCISPSYYIKDIFNELNKITQADYEITLEVTHHGPFMEKPLLFIEIGSTEKEWENKNAGSIIAKTLIHVLNSNEKNYESLFVIGGQHYNNIANKVMLKTEYAAGHICAKYNLQNLNAEIIKEAMEKTIPKSKLVLLDWKGLGKEKQRIVDILEKNNIEYKRSDRFFEN